MDPELKRLLDREQIVDVFNRYASGIDLRDAELYRSCFTDGLEVDLSGTGPGHCKAEEWVAQAFRAVSGFQTTQHIITNHQPQIREDEATCVAYLLAQHWNPENAFLVGGYYTDELVRTPEGWKIRKLVLTVTWTRNG